MFHVTVIDFGNFVPITCKDTLSNVPFYDDILRYFASCCSVLVDRVILYIINTRGKSERERDWKVPKNIRERVAEKSRKRENVLSISSDKITTNGPQPPFRFHPFLHGQTRFPRYPSRAAASSFASSRRRAHPRRRGTIPVPEKPPLSTAATTRALFVANVAASVGRPLGCLLASRPPLHAIFKFTRGAAATPRYLLLIGPLFSGLSKHRVL